MSSTAIEIPLSEPTIVVVPWHDEVVDRIGYDPRSSYVETFWLNVLGPTTTWIVRRIATGLDEYPGGFELDLVQTAAALGLTFTPGASNPFARSVNRCVMFGAAQPVDGGLAVRRRLPPVSARQLARMPEYLRDAHAAWHRSGPDDHDVDRARILGRAMLHAGDPGESIERQLLGLGIAPGVAIDVADELLGRRLAPT
ncbi:MAG: hypothetical protein U0Q03_02725 [Acidimicrobiales bacterium]